MVALASQVIPSRGASVYGITLAVDAGAMSVCMLGGGVLADRYSRSLVMATSDLLCFAGVLGFLFFGSHGSAAVLLVSAVLVGAGTGLYEPAHRAALPQLVPEDLRQVANSVDSGTKRLATAAGAALGGLIVAVADAHLAYLVDLGTFVLSATVLVRLSLPRVAESMYEENPSFFREIADGLREVKERPWVGAIMLQGTLQMFVVFAPAYALIPVVAQDRYGAGAFGLLSAAQFVGSMVGSIVAARIRSSRPGLVAMNALVPSCSVPLCIGFVCPLWLFTVASVVAWSGIAVFMVLWYTALQNEIPESKQGRVFSLEAIASFGLEPVALALAPAIALAIGFGSIGVIGAVTMVITTYAVLPVRHVPTFGEREATTTSRDDEVGSYPPGLTT